MKLPYIPSNEASVKMTFSFKQSTGDKLAKYQACYKAEHNIEITMKDMVEAMLTDYMADDKAFQKFLKQQADKPVASPAGSLATVDEEGHY